MQLEASTTRSRSAGWRWLRTALISIIALPLVLIAVDPASAVDDGSYGIRPATEADFFHLSVSPGAAVETSAIVTNHTSDAVTLRAYPVDATSDANGFAMQDEAAPRETVGAWVELARDEVTVPPHSELELPLRLTVPRGTMPGDYAGAVIIQAPPQEGETTELEDGTSVRLDVVQRLGVRIYLDVAGEAVIGLEPGELDVERRDGSLTVTLPLTNTGNTNLAPQVEAAIEGWPGGRRQLTFEATEELLTGSTHILEDRVDNLPPIFIGSADATITSEAGETQLSAPIFYIEWPLLLGAALLLVVAAFITWRVTRFVRRARRALAEVQERGERT